MNQGLGIVLFADVVDSRRDPARSSAWLRTLCAELETLYARADRLAISRRRASGHLPNHDESRALSTWTMSKPACLQANLSLSRGSRPSAENHAVHALSPV